MRRRTESYGNGSSETAEGHGEKSRATVETGEGSRLRHFTTVDLLRGRAGIKRQDSNGLADVYLGWSQLTMVFLAEVNTFPTLEAAAVSKNAGRSTPAGSGNGRKTE